VQKMLPTKLDKTDCVIKIQDLMVVRYLMKKRTNNGRQPGACRAYGIKAKNELSEDRFCRICSVNSELLTNKPVKYGPLR